MVNESEPALRFRDDDADLSNHSTMVTGTVRLPFPDDIDASHTALRPNFVHPLVQAMYDRYIAVVHDQTAHLAAVVGDRQASLEFGPPRVRFSADQFWQVQVVGYECTRNSAWMWAWADLVNDLPQASLAAAHQLRDFGRRKKIPELSMPLLSPGVITPQLLTAVACGLASAQAYHRVEVLGGAVYVLINDPRFPPNIVDPVERFAEIFPQVATQHPCNNRDAFIAYARHFGMEPVPENGGLVVRETGGRAVLATFDRLGRMVNLKVFK